MVVISWNRSHFLKSTLESIARCFSGVTGDVFVVDNGSDAETRQVIRATNSLSGYLLLHRNVGINAALERFLPRTLTAQYDTVLISDADMAYRHSFSIAHQILQQRSEIGAVSYQHSPEHTVVDHIEFENRRLLLKQAERGCSLFVRSEDLDLMRPLPIDQLKDFDWWVCRDAPRSLQSRRKPVVVLAGGAQHLGWRHGDSTWQDAEINEYPEFRDGVGDS